MQNRNIKYVKAKKFFFSLRYLHVICNNIISQEKLVWIQYFTFKQLDLTLMFCWFSPIIKGLKRSNLIFLTFSQS